MATKTATIRVARRTRDMLAEQARTRGVSVASLLADIAREREVQLIWDSEREASRRDSENTAVVNEDAAWDTTLDDGID